MLCVLLAYKGVGFVGVVLGLLFLWLFVYLWWRDGGDGW